MPAAAAIPAGAGLIGSFMQNNAQKSAASQNQSQESALDSQVEQIYNRMWGQYQGVASATNPAGDLQQAKNFYQSEVQGGLSPAVTGAANSQFQQQNALNLNTLKNQLGPYTPNMAGTVSNFQNNEIMGNVSLQQQLAAQNQGVRAQGAQGLAGIGQGVLNYGANVGSTAASGLGGLAQGFQQANEFNANNAYANNPFSALANMNWSQLLGGGGASSPTATQTPQTYTGPQLSGGPLPGQGGLGATGGSGTSGFG